MRLRIIHKMLLGYALYLTIAFSFGVYVYTQIGQIMAIQNLVEIADDSKEELLELRRNEKNYIIRRDPVYIDKIHQIIARLQSHLSKIKPNLLSTFTTEDYKNLIYSLRNYSFLMEKFSSNHHSSASLTKELRTIGREIEHKILATENYQLIREVLEIRLLEKNYVLFMETSYLRDLKNKVQALHPQVESEMKDCLLCAVYLDTAEKLFRHNKIESELLTAIRSQANTMETIITTLADKERENISGYVVHSQRILLAALIALAIFGSLLSWVLAKAILSPLQKLESTVRKISQGDFDLRLETKGDVETSSLQQSFNTMLDTLDLARESLEKTVHLLQEKSVQLIESEKLASVGILASGVAHEINNPLANISLTAETMRDAWADLSEEERSELVTDILSQTERASMVVNNLLGYARSMKNRTSAAVDICKILKQSITLLAHEIKLHDIEVCLDIRHCPIYVQGNLSRLEQVFVNIILNGVQAMEAEGLLTVRASRDESGTSAVIEIEDTGPGIAEEHITSIFDPFFTTKSAGEGTGLGLYVSYGIIHEHGGEIEVKSPGPSGTVFIIRLPLAASAEEAH